MGRTPLFRLLQRAAAIARASRHVRMPLDEFVDAVRVQRIDPPSASPAAGCRCECVACGLQFGACADARWDG
jgi:hypothetical protein